MKIYYYLFLLVFLSSCHVTETLTLDENGVGSIEIEEVRDEDSYMKIAGDNYGKEEKFVDTTYYFKDVLVDTNPNFSNLSDKDKNIFSRYKDVEVIINKNSYAKDFRTRIYQKFEKLEEVPDLYKTEDYFDDIKKNYALSAEEHYFNISYSFDGTVFRRIAKITNKNFQEQKSSEIENLKSQFKSYKINQIYTLDYNFENKILKVSNPKAVISPNRKQLILKFLLSDCIQDPEITNLEVVLEKK